MSPHIAYALGRCWKMEKIMSNLKILTTITIATTIATFLAASASAQDSGSDTVFDPLLGAPVADFVSADLDQDGRLNLDEFTTFAVMRSENGDESFKDIVIGGEYRLAFSRYDTDASGGLGLSELSASEENLNESAGELASEEDGPEAYTPEN